MKNPIQKKNKNGFYYPIAATAAISLYVWLACGRASDGTRGTNKRRREEPHRAVSVLQ